MAEEILKNFFFIERGYLNGNHFLLRGKELFYDHLMATPWFREIQRNHGIPHDETTNRTKGGDSLFHCQALIPQHFIFSASCSGFLTHVSVIFHSLTQKDP